MIDCVIDDDDFLKGDKALKRIKNLLRLITIDHRLEVINLKKILIATFKLKHEIV